MRVLAVRAHALREMMRVLRRRPGNFVLAVLLCAVALVLPLTGAALARAVLPLVDPSALGPAVSLFLAQATPAADIRQLQAQLATQPGVARVEWITREAAYTSLLQRAGAGWGELKSNPLPDVLVVTFAPRTAPATVEAAVSELRSLPKVDSVSADTGWHHKLDALLRVGSRAGLFVAGMSVAVLALIVLGAAQLQLATSRDEVRVLNMAGADVRFIVRPFAYAGAVTLACGAALAAALTAGAVALLGPSVSELMALYGLTVSIAPLPATWLAAAIAGAAVIGGVAASLGMRATLASLR